MAPSSPRNPIVCSQIVYLIPRKEKSSEVGLFPPLCKEVMRLDQMRTKPLCPLYSTPPTRKHCSDPSGFTLTDCIQMTAAVGKQSGIHVGNNRKRKLTAVNSSDGTTVAARREKRSRRISRCCTQTVAYIRFKKGNSVFEV